MSYDLIMTVAHDDIETVQLFKCDESTVYEDNITWNVRPIFIACLGGQDMFKGKDDGTTGIYRLDGGYGYDMIELLPKALKYLRENSDAMKALNPKNGWGNVQTVDNFLVELLKASHLHPSAMVKIRN
jgi:hypothetical protein|tara:strand:+ start:316 stop:699 length:384 start_codon:yes stop_codon:yes gene_type:complete